MGMRRWWYLDALAAICQSRPLPARLRICLASGLAERSGAAELDARRADCGPWVRSDGIKFYADGWLVPAVSGRSDRPGFATPDTAPEHSRLPLDLAIQLATDETAGRTHLSADPRAGSAEHLDQIEVPGTAPAPS